MFPSPSRTSAQRGKFQARALLIFEQGLLVVMTTFCEQALVEKITGALAGDLNGKHYQDYTKSSVLAMLGLKQAREALASAKILDICIAQL